MYRIPGIHEREAFTHMFECVETLSRASNGNLHALVHQMFTTYVPNLNRPVRLLSVESEVLALVPQNPLPNGSTMKAGDPVHKAWCHFLLRILYHMKVGPGWYPAYLEYHRSPVIKFDEAVDRILSSHIVWPALSDMQSDEPKLAEFRGVVTEFAEWFLTRAQERRMLAQAVTQATSDLGYRILKDGPDSISQAEKSAFLVLSDNSVGTPGCSRILEHHLLPAGAQGYMLAYNTDPRVAEVFKEFLSVVEPGPFLRFGKLMSNANLQELFAVYQPHMPNLKFDFAYTTSPGGGFLKFVPERNDQFVWDASIQYAREREDLASTVYNTAAIARSRYALSTGGVRFETTDSGSSLTDLARIVPFQAPVIKREITSTATAFANLNDEMAGFKLPVRWDLDVCKLKFPKGFESRTHEYVVEWYSPLRDRVITSDAPYSADTTDLLADIALRAASVGDNLFSPNLITSWAYIDPDCYKTGTALRELILVPELVAYNETVFYREKPWSKALSERDVDVRSVYTQLGRVMLCPPGVELVRPAKSYFFQYSEPVAESYITLSLGLNREMAAMNHQAIAVSHAVARWRRLFRTDVTEEMSIKAVLTANLITTAQIELRMDEMEEAEAEVEGEETV